MSTILSPVLHAVIAVGLLAAYTALRMTGHDDPTLLGILGGQLGGLGVTQVAQQVDQARNGVPVAQVSPPAPTGLTVV